MLIYALAAVLLIAKLFPQTPSGKLINRLLVEAPARWLADASPGTMALSVVTCSILLLLSFSLPFDLALLAAVDITGYLEILAGISASLVLLGGRNLISGVRTLLSRVPARLAGVMRPVFRSDRAARRSRTRPVAARPHSSDEDAPATWATLAFA